MSKNNGGAAFPCKRDYGDELASSAGMTLRDYFAAKAMGAATPQFAHDDERPGTWEEQLAADSYAIADAMLAARGE